MLQLVSIAELERKLALSPGSARRMAASGQLPHVVLPDGEIKFDIEDVARVLQFRAAPTMLPFLQGSLNVYRGIQ